MPIHNFINQLKYFIILNPFISMVTFIVIGIIIQRLYFKLNPNYIIMKGKRKS